MIFGPHCDHPECSMIACDNVPMNESGVLYGCREQETCPYCGPGSPNWRRIATEWTAWCTETYGTANSAELRKTQAALYPNVLATAELVEAHPVPAEGSPRA